MRRNLFTYEGAFGACVDLLNWGAARLNPYWPGGMNYTKINVILFCIILPILGVLSLAGNVIALAVWLGFL